MCYLLFIVYTPHQRFIAVNTCIHFLDRFIRCGCTSLRDFHILHFEDYMCILIEFRTAKENASMSFDILKNMNQRIPYDGIHTGFLELLKLAVPLFLNVLICSEIMANSSPFHFQIFHVWHIWC